MTVISMGEDKLNGIDIDTDGHTARRHTAPLAIDAEPNSVPAAGWPAGRGTPYPAHGSRTVCRSSAFMYPTPGRRLQSRNRLPGALSWPKHCDNVDDYLRLWNVHDGVAINNAATVAIGNRNHLPLDNHRERLHSLFPPWWQATGPVELLFKSGRQAAILWSIVFADYVHLPGPEVAAIGTVIDVPAIVIMMRPVLVPVLIIVMPVFGPRRPAQ